MLSGFAADSDGPVYLGGTTFLTFLPSSARPPGLTSPTRPECVRTASSAACGVLWHFDERLQSDAPRLPDRDPLLWFFYGQLLSAW